MENIDQLISSKENRPREIDLFSEELENQIKREGQIYLRKIEPIVGAEQVHNAQKVQTILSDGTLESEVEAQPGDWIITGSKGERFVFKDAKFKDLYDERTEGVYVPKKRKIIALKNPLGEPIRIVAPWSTSEKQEYQDGSEKAMLVLSLNEYNQLTKDRYLIGDEELLLNNYKKSLEQFRHIKGNDEAVAQIGSQEQIEKLLNIFENPESHSREELIGAMTETYSGEAYGDEHFEKEYEQWGGPNNGELVTTIYGEFRKKYPELVQLSLDPGFMNHLSEFMEMFEKEDFTSMNYMEVRNLFKEKLGTKEVYRGMTLSEEEARAMKSSGVISSLGRYIKNSEIAAQDEFEAKIISIRTKDSLEHHFYGGASNSAFISVSSEEGLAATLGQSFGKKGDGKKPYLVKIKIPIIELIYQEHGHKVDSDTESFVFWKIDPEEILEIKEVKSYE